MYRYVWNWSIIKIGNQKSFKFVELLNRERVAHQIVTYCDVWRILSEINALSTSDICSACIENSAMVDNDLMRFVYENAVYACIEYTNIPHNKVCTVLNVDPKLVKS